MGTPRLPRLLPGLTRENLPRELLAGLTLVAVSVPLNIGYAQIAGLPATAGLYALVLPSLVFALAASTRQLVVAPDAAAAAMVAASLTGVGVAGGTDDYLAAAAAQALLGGLLFLVCAKLRLGFLGRFLSHPVLVGFIAGLALEVLLSQVAKMLGLSLESEEFFARLGELVRHLGEAHGPSAALSAGCLAVLLLGRRFARRVPWALVVMVGATVLSATADLAEHGVAVLGELPSGLPSFVLPSLPVETWLALLPAAFALTAVTLAEGLALSRSYARQNGYEVDLDRDLAAFGLANIASGTTGGFTVGSSTSRTAAMDAAGARTQLPLLVLAGVSVLLIGFGAAALELVPAPAIGATVAVAVAGLVGVRDFADLLRRSRDEWVVAVVCTLGVLVLGPISGLLLAFFLALVNFVRRSSTTPGAVLLDPRSDSPDGVLEEGTVVLRIGGPVYFANVDPFEEQMLALAETGDVRRLVLDLSATRDLDVTAAGRWDEVVNGLLADGVRIDLTRVSDELEARLTQLGVLQGLPRHPTNRAALADTD